MSNKEVDNTIKREGGEKEGDDKLRQMMERLMTAEDTQPKEAQTDHKFWNTQPVPRLDEKVQEEGPIERNTPKQDVKQEPYKLPTGFCWSVIDLNQEAEMDAVYGLLMANYVEDDDASFRFNYKKEFLRWGLQPPGYQQEWHIGVRVEATGKLMGFISGIPAQMRVRKQAKRLAPVLIKEVTRRVNLCGIFQAVYTSGTTLPKPVSICRYFHRSLNPKKLIEVGFSHLPHNSTMARQIKAFKVPETPLNPTLRVMQPGDTEEVTKLLNEYLSTYDFAPVFSLAEVKHWFTPIDEVMYSYVTEVDGKIDAFVSFYCLPSTIINHPLHKELNAMYLFYYVPPKSGDGLKGLVDDALVMAKKAGADAFNCLNLLENDTFIEALKFGRGDGNLHYYLYNYRAFDVTPAKTGLVMI